ncbi:MULTISPECIES: DUF1656 domain-containing protein [Pseudomonas]|uniref:DUF1656 domain-containing protein n=1 Tax=Pseudomonas putida TaxID=303 RepID=A0A2S3XD20_PSEPU|nr:MULTISPECIES: DUF1656 domain-containing protein [Pseudomonas]PTC01734.1 DUF1656 domain-containing protein [Thalassospira xiamenensis]AVD83794.1 DUF1656 domain-containing protein [Pseudomonas sp. SWI6]AVD95036.1 DUF1656 domain-containing protein [Pseudomonas sp. SWI36]ELU0814722.1 DUF1656 domain-containing protein [Pseudomonas putida]MBH3388263.1 DUF1656 domain-containing protein [Pseudomonas putida]
MLREFSVAGLLVSPMVLCALIAGGLTVITQLLVPHTLLKHWTLRRSWLGLSLFVCYVAATVAFLDGDLK